jgi:hypothetical protein
MPHPKSYFAYEKKLFTIEQTMERLKELTGAKPLPQIDPMEKNQPVKPITVKPVVPAAYVAEPPTLEWGRPSVLADGSATIISTGKTYSVLREANGGGGNRYLAFHGISVLAPACATAEYAKAHCEAHYKAGCGAQIDADKGTI